MDEFRARRVVDALRDRGVNAHLLRGGIGKFGIRVGSEPNDHVWLARLHEFSFDLVPSSTLSRIGSDRLQPSIELSLLSIG